MNEIKNKLDENIDLNEDFKKALDIMENSNQSLFITGRAGTGKSTLLTYFKKYTKKNVVVCAPTGLAAINIEGQTIHSLFKLPPKLLDASDIKKVYHGFYKHLDAIIIDEVSMVRVDMFDAIDMFMRMNGKDRNKPFGGIQILLFGDLFQLPPVVENESGKILKQLYPSPYFFDAHVMNHLNIEVINLAKVYRQKDSKFIGLLDKIRLGNLNESVLEEINSNVGKTKDEEAVILTPTNKIAGAINQGKLDQLNTQLFSYKAIIEGEFNMGINNLPADLEIYLKKGARVIFTKNDSGGRWVNGTLGKVMECGEESVKVKLDEDSSVVDVGFVEWDKIRYELDPFTKRITSKILGKFRQIPLKLAWALTIHKCQGQTLDKVHVDISSGVWEHGHVYVALSRCRTLEGLSLASKVWINDITIDQRVVDFLKNRIKESFDVGNLLEDEND